MEGKNLKKVVQINRIKRSVLKIINSKQLVQYEIRTIHFRVKYLLFIDTNSK